LGQRLQKRGRLTSRKLVLRPRGLAKSLGYAAVVVVEVVKSRRETPVSLF